MSEKNLKVDFFFANSKKWRSELEKLRGIALASGLTEELKWGVPCYTLNNANVFLVHEFKEYCAMLFVKGALMKDPNGILIQQTENVQAGRQARFTDLKQVVELEPILKAYIDEAITIERSGLKVPLKKASEYAVADEFLSKLEENPELEKAFYALTPGRQRAYLLFFSAPKQSQTRESRVEKCIPQILAGKGLND
jgi:uncharacterized protein YdeI (YjbR/CyaY-like superfamily)